MKVKLKYYVFDGNNSHLNPLVPPFTARSEMLRFVNHLLPEGKTCVRIEVRGE